MKQVFSRTVRIDRSAEAVFAWHENPAALARLNPPWERVRVVQQSGGVGDGARVILKAKVGPIETTWEMEHFDCRPGSQFCDRQLQGPFKSWTHFHRFKAVEAEVCELTDEIHYELPFGPLGGIGANFVTGKLEQLFAYRQATTKADLEAPVRGVAGRVVISGASGLIGQALVPFLRMGGWQVDGLVRREARTANEIEWNPSAGTVKWPQGYAPDAVIHLAGANIADGRWTAARRQSILKSRVEGTRTLALALQDLATPPRVWLSGSATGFYGEQGDVEVDELAPRGAGFLAEVVEAWERETAPATALGVRTVHLRSGVVLSAGGGALGKMLPAFSAGVGGPLGDGTQWMSWIGLEDWMRACAHALQETSLTGPVNLVAPAAVQNGFFARTLGEVLRRPAILPVPAVVLQMLLGQMADEALLASTRVAPRRLEESGFKFLHPTLENTLRHVLGKVL